MVLFNKAQQTIVYCPWANITDNKQAAITFIVHTVCPYIARKTIINKARDSQCPVHITGRFKDALNVSQIVYKIHKQLFPFLTMFFHTPTSLTSQCKLNILTGAPGLSAHMYVPQRSTAPLPEGYSTTFPPQTIHSDHTMLTQKHLFLVLLHFCLTMRILNKTQKVHMFLPLSRVCCKHALNLQGQTLLHHQPWLYTAFSQYRYMPELIKLWKNPTEEANK